MDHCFMMSLFSEIFKSLLESQSERVLNWLVDGADRCAMKHGVAVVDPGQNRATC